MTTDESGWATKKHDGKGSADESGPVQAHPSTDSRTRMQEELVEAVLGGDARKAAALLLRGTDPNSYTSRYPEGFGSYNVGNMAPLLIVATLTGNQEMVELLLEGGARVDATSHSRHSCMSNDDEYTEDEGSALTFAAELGHLAIVKLLIDRGAGLEVTNSDGQTAFSLACQHGHAEIMDLLLSKKAEIHRRDGSGLTAKDHAARHGYFEIVERLKRAGCRGKVKINWNEAILNGSIRGDTKMVEHALQHGDPNARSIPFRNTPLMYAAEAGHIDVARLLAANGAELDLCSERGWTALSLAIKHGKSEMVRFLAGRGARFEPESRIEEAVRIAISEGHSDMPEVIKELKDLRRVPQAPLKPRKKPAGRSQKGR